MRARLRDDLCAIARLTQVEIASALARRHREGTISQSEQNAALATLACDADSLYLVEMTAKIVARSQALLARHPLRAGDAIQLASCLELAAELRYPTSFMAFDDRLVDAARAEGLPIA